MDWLNIVVEIVKVVPSLVTAVRAIADEVETDDSAPKKAHDTIQQLEQLLANLKSALPAA